MKDAEANIRAFEEMGVQPHKLPRRAGNCKKASVKE